MNPFQSPLTKLHRSLADGDPHRAAHLAWDIAVAVRAMRSDDTPPTGAPAMPAPPAARLIEAVA
ncbi:MAG TPA: hypothetical protein DEB47_17605 [Citreicella sp.]|nr:hypothetical protein [Citreicella sp.]